MKNRSLETLDIVLLLVFVSMFVLLNVLDVERIYLYIAGLVAALSFLGLSLWGFFIYSRKEEGYFKIYYMVLSAIGIIFSLYGIYYVVTVLIGIP